MSDRLIETGRCCGMEMNVENSKVMRNSSSHSHYRLWKIKNQLYNVKCFNYLCTMTTNDARCTREIKHSFVVVKAVFNKKTFHQQIGLKFKEETSKMPNLEYSIIFWWKMDTSQSRSEIPGKFWNVVLEKDGKDQLDRSCEKLGSRSIYAVKEDRNVLYTIKSRTANLDWSHLA